MNLTQSVTAKTLVEATRHNDATQVNGFKRVLLGISVATAILSSIPPFRLAGAIATRSIAVLAVSADCATIDSKVSALQKISKVAIVGLGLVGLAIASPCLLLASLVSDLGLQTIHCLKATWNGRGEEAVISGSMAVVDALILGATLAGSWPVMVTATLVNACVMFGFAIAATSRDKDANSWEALAYATLGALSFLNTAALIKATRSEKTLSNFKVTNDSEDTLHICDKAGSSIKKVGPHEELAFVMPYKDTRSYTKMNYICVSGSPATCVGVPEPYGSYLDGVITNPTGDLIGTTKIHAFKIDISTIVIKAPLPVATYPTLPMGGNVTVLTDHQ